MNAPAPGTPSLDNPFIGVRPYPEGRPLYGREQESAELADLLISRRMVLMYSPSGAGKTSLINTALRKDLALRGKGRFRLSKAIRVGYLPEGLAGNRYVASALHHLEKSFPEDEQLHDAALAEFTIARYLAERWDPRMQADEPRSRRDLLVFDQFEELFTLDPTDVDAKREFLAQVAEALGNRDEDEEAAAGRAPLRWALFAMREDFIAELDPYKAMLPTALATRFRMNLLTREQAKRVILCTAADAGAEFGEDAIERIVADLSRVRAPRGAANEWVDGLFVEPVQLQVVCRRLWSRHMRDGKRHLRPEDLQATADTGDDARALGAVDDALAQFYADCVSEAAGGSTTRERAIRDWIEGSLVSKAKLRSQVMLDPATPLPVTDDALRALGGTLLRKDVRGGREWIELTHDRLIEPLLWENNRWRAEHLSLLQMQAHLWNAAGRREGFLLNGRDLEQAAEWAATHDHELSDTDRDFLAAALKARDDAEGRRRYRRTVALLGVLGILVLFGTGFGYSLYGEKKKAEAEQAIAQRQGGMSGIRFNLSEADVRRARDPLGAIGKAFESERDIRKQEELLAEHRRRKLLGAEDDAEVHRQLTSERITLEATLINSLRDSPPVLLRYTGHQNAVRNVLYVQPDRVVSAGYDGELQYWRTADGTRIDAAPGRGTPLFALAFDAASGLLADGDGRERIRLWRPGADRLELVAEIAPSPGAGPARIAALAFTAGGQVLVASTWDRRLVFFDISRPDAPRPIRTVTPRVHKAVVYSLAANADGTLLATGSWDGSVALWRNLPTPRAPDAALQVVRLPPPAERERAANPSTDRRAPEVAAINSVAIGSRWLAAGGHDGSLLVWDLASSDVAGSVRELSGGHEGTVFGVAFDKAETTLATVGIDRRLLLWSLRDMETWEHKSPLPLRESIPELQERLYGVAFSPDPLHPEQLALAGGPSVFILDVERPPSPLAAKLHVAGEARARGRWQGIAITDDATTVLASNGDTVWRWKRETGGELVVESAAYIQHKDLTRLAMDAIGSLLLTGARDGTVRVWRLGRGDRMELAGQGGSVGGVAVSRDATFAAAGRDDQILVWRLGPDGGATQLLSESLGTRVRALAFDSRGRQLAAGGADGSVHLWRVTPEGVQKVQADAAQGSEINVVAFQPGDAVLATGAEDSTIATWNIVPGSRPALSPGATYTEHKSGVVSLAFCGTEAQPRLFSSDRDGQVVVRLSMQDQRHRRALMESYRKPRYLAATPDCRHVATSGDTPLVWNLDPEVVQREACRLVSVDEKNNPIPACLPYREARKP